MLKRSDVRVGGVYTNDIELEGEVRKYYAILNHILEDDDFLVKIYTIDKDMKCTIKNVMIPFKEFVYGKIYLYKLPQSKLFTNTILKFILEHQHLEPEKKKTR